MVRDDGFRIRRPVFRDSENAQRNSDDEDKGKQYAAQDFQDLSDQLHLSTSGGSGSHFFDIVYVIKGL